MWLYSYYRVKRTLLNVDVYLQYKRQSHSCYKDREKLCGQMQAARTGKRTMTEKDVVKVGEIRESEINLGDY